MLWLLCLFGLGLLVGYAFIRQDRPHGTAIALVSIAGILLFGSLYVREQLTARPNIGQEFDHAVAWALADALTKDHQAGLIQDGTVLVLQEQIFKTTPSWEAQQAGIREGLKSGLTPKFVSVVTAATESQEMKTSDVLLQLEKLPAGACALISLTPVAKRLTVSIAENLPPLYLLELQDTRTGKVLLKKGIAKALVSYRPGVDMSVPPKGKSSYDFALRHDLFRAE